MLGRDPCAEDLAQAAFVAFHANARQIRNPSALQAYLVATTVNLASTELRTRYRRHWVGLSEAEELPDGTATWADVEHREVLGALSRALDGLGPRQRTAFVLR